MNVSILVGQAPPVAPIWFFLFGTAMFVTAIFLILLVLVQRGRGGGLAGAFGGAGGQSAFGAKAGDTFTKVTIYASTFWILLCMGALAILNPKPPSDAAAPPGISSPDGAGVTVDGAAADGAATDGTSADGAAADGTSADGTGADGAADEGAADGTSDDSGGGDDGTGATDGESVEGPDSTNE